MSKKLKDLKWETVALEGVPNLMTEKLQGFVGLEECTNYGFDKERKTQKKKNQKKRKIDEPNSEETPPKMFKVSNKTKSNKKTDNNTKTSNNVVKLDNGFTVESCASVKPSTTNENVTSNEKTKKKKKRRSKKKNKKSKESTEVTTEPKKETTQNKIIKKGKLKLGENEDVKSTLTAEDMLTWAEFKLQEPIMRALTELGFKKPTKIQELTLPAAIHGRRDILGAAETGSGKTLAFGLPILSGILKLKEKAEMGLDVYELPYKKASAKRKNKEEPVKKPKKGKDKNKKIEKKGLKVEQKAKESSEDGYGTDDEADDGSSDDETPAENKFKVKISKSILKTNKTENDDEEYLEEIDVPVRKRKETSADEGNDSDDSDNYTHLSEMLDSDDLANSSDDGSETANDKTVSDEDTDNESYGDNDIFNESDECDDEATESGDENEAEVNDSGDNENDPVDAVGLDEGEEINENEQGLGCVKVIDNVEMPGHMVVKTGKPLFALILTPTRELAMQISQHLKAVAKYTGIKVATIVGGMAAVKQERVLRSGPEVVVATPGRLWELITQGQSHLQQLDCVKFLAIDETDRMVERGHFEELHPLLERLNADESRRGTRQNFVFSATLTMVHELPLHARSKKVTKRGKIINKKIEKMTPQQKIKKLVDMIGMTEPKVVDITTQNLGTAETLTESRIACALEQKDAYLYYILKRHPGRTIVFCNSIGSVKRLAQLFTMLKCRPLPLHASMPQRQRLKNLERFRDDPHGVLVATDVAARGLDIPDVDHVIHYQVPRTAENYVHRSGRTARATKEGLTILMMEPSEAYLYSKLCRTLNKTSEVPLFPVPPQQLGALKQLLCAARELDALWLARRRAQQAQGWRDKAAREMDIIIDDDVLPMKEIDPSIDKALSAKKRQLESMLNRPLFPRGFSFKYPTLNDPAIFAKNEDNALQVMKKAIESGELKKEKRKSKNAPLLKLQKSGKVNKIKKKKK